MAKRKAIKRPGKGSPAFGGTGGSDPSGMMARLQMLQQQMEEAQAQLSQESVTGTAGGGVVKITVTGDQRCTAVEVAKELLEDGDVDILQDLLLSAINNALDASRALAEQKMGPASGGLDLPF